MEGHIYDWLGRCGEHTSKSGGNVETSIASIDRKIQTNKKRRCFSEADMEPSKRRATDVARERVQSSRTGYSGTTVRSMEGTPILPRPQSDYDQESHVSYEQTLPSPSSRSRSSSPGKRRLQTLLSTPRITRPAQPDVQKIQHLPLFSSLWGRLMHARDKVPEDLRIHLEDQNPFQLESRPSLQFTNDPSVNRDTMRLWRKVQKIKRRTAECVSERETEEGWSDKVVLPVLNYARKRLDESRVCIKNVKSIDISPIDLLPKNAKNRPIGKRRVDYAFTLDVGTKEERLHLLIKLDNQTSPGESPSLCQAEHFSVSGRPIFSSLEIKRTASGEDGEDQLGIWCAAGFKKLTRLGKAQPLPVIPVWLVEGQTWSLFIASQEDVSEMFLQGPLRQWSTMDEASTVQLILTLGTVMQWGDDAFFPWFKENILPQIESI